VLPGWKDLIVLDQFRGMCGERQKDGGGQHGGA
jgi:hypothetical protein